MIKRLLDLTGSVFGLILLSPVFAGIALAVKLGSAGPVFFRQERVGLHGSVFRIFKFRSMTVSNAGPEVTVSGDARVTKVGRFIRRTKLDELPQLINVARGEMSLVGPRPEVPRYMALYAEEQRRIILSVKPGMTDFAAIELRDEEGILAGYPDHHQAYVEVLMPMKARLYSRYVEEQSLLTDLTLIVRTISAILFR